MTTMTMPVQPLAPAADVYRNPAFELSPSSAQAAQFSSALERAQEAQATQTAPGATVDHYVRSDLAAPAVLSGDGGMEQLGHLGTSMSRSFRHAIDETFAEMSNIDFTEPASMVKMMEVQLGVLAASTHVQFATKVADFSSHALTTLFRNQG